MKKYLLITLLALSASALFAQKQLKEYAPVLQKTLDRAIKIDQNKGYSISKITPSIYLLTDGLWQSAAVVSKDEVILIDAPESFGSKIEEAVKSVTSKPITTLIYSHGHSDHIGGSVHLKDIKGLKIISLKVTSEFIKEQNDPRRLVPTIVFEGEHVLKSGKTSIHLNNHMNYHSPEGDLFISVPEEKFLMVIDVLAPGYVPFKNLDLTNNMHEYIKVFDKILTYNFDVFIGGHLTSIGNKNDVLETQAYVKDLYETVKRIHTEKNKNLGGVMGEAAKEIGWNNKYLLFKVFLDQVIEESALEIEERWKNKLAGVDVWSRSHASTMLNYVRWDD